MLQNANVNAPDAHGMTALMAALNKNRLPVVELLLQLGPDFTMRDDQGRTCLTLAAQAGRAELIKKLLDEEPGFKSTINQVDFQGRPPILWAGRQGHAEVVGLLLEHGADPNATDKFDKDAQDYAGAAGFVEIAKVRTVWRCLHRVRHVSSSPSAGVFRWQMLRLGVKGLMIIRTDRWIEATEAGDEALMDELAKKEIEMNRMHSTHGVYVPRR